jgi:hypothetical protein
LSAVDRLLNARTEAGGETVDGRARGRGLEYDRMRRVDPRPRAGIQLDLQVLSGDCSQGSRIEVAPGEAQAAVHVAGRY